MDGEKVHTHGAERRRGRRPDRPVAIPALLGLAFALGSALLGSCGFAVAWGTMAGAARPAGVPSGAGGSGPLAGVPAPWSSLTPAEDDPLDELRGQAVEAPDAGPLDPVLPPPSVRCSDAEAWGRSVPSPGFLDRQIAATRGVGLLVLAPIGTTAAAAALAALAIAFSRAARREIQASAGALRGTAGAEVARVVGIVALAGALLEGGAVVALSLVDHDARDARDRAWAEALTAEVLGAPTADPRERARRLGTVLARAPDTPAARLARGRLLWLAGDGRRAESELRRVPIRSPSGVPALLLRGLDAAFRRRVSVARSLLGTVAAHGTGDETACAVSVLAGLGGDWDGARSSAAGVGGSEAALVRAWIARTAPPRDLAAAERAYGEVLRAVGESAWIQLERARCRRALGDEVGARADAAAAAAQRPGYADDLILSGQDHVRWEDLETAEVELAAARLLGPTDPFTLSTGGVLAYWVHDYQAALEMFDECLRRGPDRAGIAAVRFWRDDCAQKLGVRKLSSPR
ncbi:MAG: hypothetical protein L0216_09085 [Planctomycetales bacterium]|nr:hypothetical protein [Planctomycetales bacterium]